MNSNKDGEMPTDIILFPLCGSFFGLSLIIHVVISLTKSDLVIFQIFNQPSDLYPHFNYMLIIVLWTMLMKTMLMMLEELLILRILNRLKLSK